MSSEVPGGRGGRSAARGRANPPSRNRSMASLLAQVGGRESDTSDSEYPPSSSMPLSPAPGSSVSAATSSLSLNDPVSSSDTASVGHGSLMPRAGSDSGGPSPGVSGLSATGTDTESVSTVQTVEVTYVDKPNVQRKTGTTQNVVTNYFRMNRRKDFQLFGYRVDFDPPEDNTKLKRMLMEGFKQHLGNFTFDGHTLYSGSDFENQLLTSSLKDGAQEYSISVRQVTVQPSEKIYVQFYNIALRGALEKIGMEQIGRHYYDRHQEIDMPEEKLTLWPGFITAVRQHDAGMLLCVEVTHKVLRKETAYDVMTITREQNRRRGNDLVTQKKKILEALQHSIVITHYKRKTYRIDDIDFDATPASQFQKSDGTLQSYSDYFYEKYHMKVQDLHQPMLVTFPRKKDINKGVEEPIYLVPELCFMTGLTDEMRKNFQLMKKLSVHLHMSPEDRKRKLHQFITKFQSKEIVEEFRQWHFEFDTEFVGGQAYLLDRQPVSLRTMNGEEKLLPDNACDWTCHFKNAGLLEPVTVGDWVMFIPQDTDIGALNGLIDTLERVGRRLGVNFRSRPVIVKYEARRAFDYASFMKGVKSAGRNFEFVFYILPNNSLPRYASVKKACTLDLQLVSQCFQSKHLRGNKNLNSICQKLLIQVNAKMKGEPWAVHIPLKKMMVLGFDVYHCPDRRGESVGALVATVNKNCTKYFSTVSFHKDKAELSGNLSDDIIKTLEAYKTQNNNELPTKILLFRDGVGEGQIEYVRTHELEQVRKGIQRFYKQNNCLDPVHLAFIIVTKKINTRFLVPQSGGKWVSPPPGSVLDRQVTLPERNEFFLISQTVRQGTVSPTNYHVVHDSTKLSEENMQILTYKLCHLYFNWSGTVAVPAPCQYAHKLAYITGMALADECPEALRYNLWYL